MGTIYCLNTLRKVSHTFKSVDNILLTMAYWKFDIFFITIAHTVSCTISHTVNLLIPKRWAIVQYSWSAGVAKHHSVMARWCLTSNSTSEMSVSPLNEWLQLSAQVVACHFSHAKVLKPIVVCKSQQHNILPPVCCLTRKREGGEVTDTLSVALANLGIVHSFLNPDSELKWSTN